MCGCSAELPLPIHAQKAENRIADIFALLSQLLLPSLDVPVAVHDNLMDCSASPHNSHRYSSKVMETHVALFNIYSNQAKIPLSKDTAGIESRKNVPIFMCKKTGKRRVPYQSYGHLSAHEISSCVLSAHVMRCDLS